MFAVGSGCFKTYAIDAEGREHVLNFHFAGELIGADAIYSERHMSNAVSLEKSTICIIPFHAISRLAHDIPELQTQLFRILSRDVIGSTSIAGDFTAEERLAAFLVMFRPGLRRRRISIAVGARPMTMMADIRMGRICDSV